MMRSTSPVPIPDRHRLTRQALILFLPLLLILTVINVALLVTSTKQTQLQIEQTILNSLRLMSDLSVVLEDSFATELDEGLQLFLAEYNAHCGKIEQIDFIGLQQQLGNRVDLYAIDASGVIRHSTLAHDVGLDFRQLPDLYDYIEDIRQSGALRIDVISKELKTGLLRKYAYLPTPDKRWILELGVKPEIIAQQLGPFDPVIVAQRLVADHPLLNQLRIIDRHGWQLSMTQPTQVEAKVFERVKRVLDIHQEQTILGWNRILRYLPLQYKTDVHAFGLHKQVVELDYNLNRAMLGIGINLLFLLAAIVFTFRMSSGMKQTEFKLRKSEEKHRRLFETMSQGVIYQTVDGSIILANTAAERILGLSYEQMKGKTYLDSRRMMIMEDGSEVQGEDHPAMIALRTGEAFGPVVRGVFHPEKNEHIWLSITAIPLFQPSQTKPFQAYIMFEDITKMKLAQDALRKSESLFKKVFEILPVGLWIADNKGKLLRGNSAAIAIWGAQPKLDQREYGFFRARHLPSGEEIAPDDWALAHTVNKGETIIDELLEIDAFDGKKKIIFNSTAPILDNSGQVEGAIVVNQDITERKKAEEKIRTINEQLQKSNAEKDKLFTIIAHDLKSPMAGVYSTSQILAEDAETFSLEEISLVSADMHKSAKNVLELLSDLMQWARMSQGGMDFSPEECSLYELAISSLDTARDVADKKNISIQSDIPEDLTVMADQAMINTVIRNVTFNAVKFTRKGGSISVTARKAGSNIEVCVQDDGIGMNEAILASVFTVDKNKKQKGTDGEKGTGLGLMLCKEFVEKHGGEIWVESEQGKGTKVFFTLPDAA